MNILGKKNNEDLDKKVVEYANEYNKKRKQYNILK
jgi:hypothetical protein